MPADLHIHTLFSDGLLSPEQIILKAKNANLAALAITDHDIVSGIDPAIAAGKAQGVRVIAGIEFTTETKDNELHILGLFLDYKNAELLEALKKIQDDRVERIKKIIEKLKLVNVNLEEDSILNSTLTGTVGRPHVARMLIKLGYALDLRDAFSKYLVKGAPGYVPHFKLSPIEAVELIRRCKGAPVFAHPGISKSDEMIPDLVKAGLCGIEVFYPAHGYAREQHYLSLTTKYNLIPTGGTDYHGTGGFNEMELGQKFTSDENVAKLEAFAHG